MAAHKLNFILQIILKTANLNALPDKGEKLKHKINELEEALINLKLEAKVSYNAKLH